MGDLRYEYQDAVIAANYVTKEQWDKQLENKAIELVYSVPQYTNIEDIERTLKEAIEENQDLSIQTFTTPQGEVITTFLSRIYCIRTHVILLNNRDFILEMM